MTAYCLEWQTRTMRAPAFWYFHSYPAARAAAGRMYASTTRTIRQVELPDTFDRWTEDDRWDRGDA